MTALKQLMTAHSGRVWGKTPVLKRYCQSNYCGRGLRPCDITRTDGSIWERGKDLSRLKIKHWVDFYHYRVVVYTHCQHTIQFKLLVKVNVALYDPFRWQISGHAAVEKLIKRLPQSQAKPKILCGGRKIMTWWWTYEPNSYLNTVSMLCTHACCAHI